ncbi:ATP-binding cassette domain-containing protein [Kitasatospora indigofera]|uniref:ATP-binding cassette domain-containing protein n=1 Tax=Kitasatospora indigofera TaxID=67307 RepID=UPI00367E8300
MDIDVRAGEIVGITGPVGSGRSSLLGAIFGAGPPTTGTVRVAGHLVRRSSPAHAVRAGLALIPESRTEQGLVGVRPVGENLALATLGTRQRAGFLCRRAEAALVSKVTDRLGIRSADARDPVRRLSGGNQQKVLFAKWLLRRPLVLMADEPTRGVDTVTKTHIHELLVDMARQGVAVLLVSSDTDEVIDLSHRVLVMRNAAIVAEYVRGAVSRKTLLTALAPEDCQSAGGPT